MPAHPATATARAPPRGKQQVRGAEVMRGCDVAIGRRCRRAGRCGGARACLFDVGQEGPRVEALAEGGEEVLRPTARRPRSDSDARRSRAGDTSATSRRLQPASRATHLTDKVDGLVGFHEALEGPHVPALAHAQQALPDGQQPVAMLLQPGDLLLAALHEHLHRHPSTGWGFSGLRRPRRRRANSATATATAARCSRISVGGS
eukprot:scaffold659_cov329-Prasinococcus_capsulatus_cf.AAC.25